jgi:hypothetical protein
MDDIGDFGGTAGPRLGDRFCLSLPISESFFLAFVWTSMPLFESIPLPPRLALGMSRPWLELSVTRVGGVGLVPFEEELLD